MLLQSFEVQSQQMRCFSVNSSDKTFPTFCLETDVVIKNNQACFVLVFTRVFKPAALWLLVDKSTNILKVDALLFPLSAFSFI